MEIKKYLDNLKIEYNCYSHPPVFSCEESEKLSVVKNGMHAKSLLLKSKKLEHYFLIILSCNEKLNIKNLEKIIGERLRFASADELKKNLNLLPGSVSPFGIINEPEKSKGKVQVYFEEKVWTSPILNFHPNKNTETIEISNEEFKKYLNSLKNKVKVFKN